jgi:hypothetical protein
MQTPVKLPFGKHLPDQPAFRNPGTPYLKNVLPASGFLRPMAGLTAYSNALSGRAQGAISGRDTSGNVYTFAGDSANLYKLAGQSWTNVSKPGAPQVVTVSGVNVTVSGVNVTVTPIGGAYVTSSSAQWEFIPWSDDILIAINGVDAPQKIDPQTGLNFADLGGSPPPAAHGAIVRSFVFLGNWAGNENLIAWSAIDNAEEWNTDGTHQSDQEFLPSGGPVMRIFGGETGIIFCQTSIYRFAYVGSPVIFQKDEIAPGVGLLASGAAAQWGDLIFFLGQNSFYRMDARGTPATIGESRWNKTFFAELDENFIDRITSAIDPINTIWIMLYPNASATNGVPNRAFIYNWATDDCAFADVDAQIVTPAYTSGFSLDDLQTITGFGLDRLPFSLDSRVWQGGQLILAAFDPLNRLAFFSGETLEAEIETSERDQDGRRIFVSGVRPLVDAANAQVAVITREFQSATPASGPYTSIGPDGLCPQHIEGRFLRARLKITAGSQWTKAQGVEAYVSPAGEL